MLARVWLVGTCDSQADSHIVRGNETNNVNEQ